MGRPPGYADSPLHSTSAADGRCATRLSADDVLRDSEKMASSPCESQRPAYWRPVTSCFLLLAALCGCCAVLQQKTINTADPLQTTSESSTMPDTTKQPETAAVDLGSLLDAGEGAVVTLVAGHTRLVAHRAVLVAGSPILATMFHRDTLPASSSEVNIPGVEGPVLRQLVAFLYTGRAPQLPGMAPQLLATAERYGVSVLEDASEQQVLQHLDVESAAAAAVVAVRLSRPSLVKAVIAFMKAHIFEVLDTHGWAEAVINHPREVVQIYHLLAQPPAETSATTTGSTPTAPAASAAPRATTTAVAATATAAATPNATATATLNTADSTSSTPAAATTTPKAAGSTSTATAAATPNAADSVSTTTAATTTTPNAADSASTATTAATATPTAADSPSTTPAAATATPTGTSRTATTAPLPTAGSHTLPPDAKTVSHLQSLSAEERGRRLIEAAKDGADQKVRALLAAGAQVEVRDGDGLTALHWAAVNGHVGVAQRLLRAGAQVGARTTGQNTPLHWAAAYGRTAVLRLLLAASADVGARNEYGRTPLHYAAYYGYAQAAAALIEAGADRAATDTWGKTPMDIAREDNQHHMIQMLQ